MADEGYFDSSVDAFNFFRGHLNELLHQTVTPAPLVQIKSGSRTLLGFRQKGEPIAVSVGKGYHLYLDQTLETKKEGDKGYRLRTIAYAYRISEGPRRADPYLFRWEYNSPEVLTALHPRHHCHLPVNLTCFERKTLSLSKLHISTGWVTVEEIIRFLIHELKVKPRSVNWDELLHRSENTFRMLTRRSA